LEYGVSVWSPHHEYLTEKLEKVQKRATKLIISIKHLKYKERLRYLKLPTLKFRCVRGDMIEVHKFFNNIYDSATTGWLTDRHMQINYDMRVHRHSLYQSQILYDTRKYSFSNRILPLWNSLPEKVVSSSTVKSLKVRLDRFWANEEIYYNYKTNISCTGS